MCSLVSSMRICGLDVHKKFVVGVIFEVDVSGNVLNTQPVRAIKVNRTLTDLDKLVSILSDYRVEKVVLESTGAYGLSVYYYLAESGFDVFMANPKDNKPSGQKKTDRLDAERLVRLFLSGHLRAYKLTHDKRLLKLKELVRGRLELVSNRTRIKNQIMSILDRFFIDIKRVFAVFGKVAIELVDGLARGEDLDTIMSRHPLLAKKRDVIRDLMKSEIDSASARILLSLLRVLRVLNEEIEEIERAIEDLLCEFEESVRLLTTIPGVGLQSAAIILAEIADIKRFSSPKKLVSYAGLVPSVYQSADNLYFGRLRVDSNRRLRWILFEVAVVAIKYSPRLRSIYSRLVSRGKPRKIAIVAVARHILIGIWHMLMKNLTWDEYIKEGYRPRRRRLKKISLGEAIRLLRSMGYELSLR